MKQVPLEAALIHGAISTESTDIGIKPWRIPHTEVDLYPPIESVPEMAQRPSGVRLRFRTTSSSIELKVHSKIASADLTFDLVEDNHLVQSTTAKPSGGLVCFQNLKDTIYEIWLPQHSDIIIESIKVEDNASIQPVQDSRIKWLSYGSSITHCLEATHPTGTWPSTAARKLDLNLTSLGYAGSCVLETMVGRLIRDSDADIITLKLGINVYHSAALIKRTWQAAVIGLVKLIREKHTETPIGLITSISSPPAEKEANAGGMTLEDYRQELRIAFETLKKHGDNKLFLFEGTSLLGHNESHLMPDLLHPQDEGYQLMGQRAAETILPILLKARQ